MPFNFNAMRRRRALLGLTQQDLGIIAGVSPTTIQRIEREDVPMEGGKTGIDVLMRIAEALKMEYADLMIAPKGNKYERAVQFAVTQRNPNPKLLDRGRTVRADGFRRLTGQLAAMDIQPLIDREEEDAEREDDPPDALDERLELEAPVPDMATSFIRDPSTE